MNIHYSRVKVSLHYSRVKMSLHYGMVKMSLYYSWVKVSLHYGIVKMSLHQYSEICVSWQGDTLVSALLDGRNPVQSDKTVEIQWQVWCLNLQ